MPELVTTLIRRKDGMYDLTIKTADGEILLDVKCVRYKRAVELLEEGEKKVDEG